MCMPRFYLLILFAVFISTCRDSGTEIEIEEPLTESDFIGSWNVARLQSDFRLTGEVDGEPLDEEGGSRVTNSALRIDFGEDGSWTSSGDYTLLVTLDGSTDTIPSEGAGNGTWSYRNDSLYVSGMENYNNNGRFADPQAWFVTDFERDLRSVTEASIDMTESEEALGISIRTQSDFTLELQR